MALTHTQGYTRYPPLPAFNGASRRTVPRNLNDGDAIYLLVRPIPTQTGQNIVVVATVRYAISLS